MSSILGEKYMNVKVDAIIVSGPMVVFVVIIHDNELAVYWYIDQIICFMTHYVMMM